jgi:hypothetical protein
MNPKQAAPLIATVAPFTPTIAPAIPFLLIGGAIFFALKCLFSDDEKEKKPETLQSNAENQRKEAETTQKIPDFRKIPAEILAKPTAVPINSAPKHFIPPISVPLAPKIPVTQALPLPIKKKFVTRNDLATVFQCGARALTRTAAVAALKNLGFGKTAAYAALTPDGRFSTWLQFAPDGIITWTE